MALTPKQQRFVDEYVVDFNATQAAIRAGYSGRTADRIGPELLGKTCVADAIAAKQAQLSERAEVSADRILAEVDTMALSDVGELFDQAADRLAMLPMREWPEAARRSVSSIKIREYPEKLPPLTEDDFQKLEAIATGKAYHFNISRAILPEDQAFMQRFVRELRAVYWSQYRVLEIKLWDKNSALDKAMRRRGLLKEGHVDLDDIREILAKQIDAIMAALPREAAEKAIAAIRPVWLAA